MEFQLRPISQWVPKPILWYFPSSECITGIDTLQLEAPLRREERICARRCEGKGVKVGVAGEGGPCVTGLLSLVNSSMMGLFAPPIPNHRPGTPTQE